MAPDPATRRWAYEELPEFSEDDGHRYEYIAGDLVVSRLSSMPHQEVLARLAIRMYRFAEGHGLGRVYIGPVVVLFAVGDYVAPDLAFVRAERSGIIREQAIEGAPDLIVEVVHPVTAERDRGIKRERYAMYGVPEFWIVDPERAQIEVHRSARDTGLVAAETLEWQPLAGGPTLVIDVAELFRDLD